MENWTREQIKADPIMMEALEYILQFHKTPQHTVKNLMSLKDVPNVCETTRMFGVLPATGDSEGVYISYDFCTWIEPKDDNTFIFPTRVDAIQLYESFAEYESTRVRELSAADPDGRDNNALNLN